MVSPGNQPQITPVPAHVAIIMDGNGRWARQRGLPRLAGHKAGTNNIRRVIEGFAQQGVKYLTLYAFSTENWGRPQEEILGLFRILREVIERETEHLNKNGIRLCDLGELEGLSTDLRRAVENAIEATQHNKRMTLNVAFNYGGRAEVLRATRRIVEAGLKPDEVNEASFGSYLYTAGMPDPDLIIRTAGEMRLSNFLIWQTAYSEYYSTPTCWPDFDETEIEKALVTYSQRRRKFGAL